MLDQRGLPGGRPWPAKPQLEVLLPIEDREQYRQNHRVGNAFLHSAEHHTRRGSQGRTRANDISDQYSALLDLREICRRPCFEFESPLLISVRRLQERLNQRHRVEPTKAIRVTPGMDTARAMNRKASVMRNARMLGSAICIPMVPESLTMTPNV